MFTWFGFGANYSIIKNMIMEYFSLQLMELKISNIIREYLHDI